MDLSVSSSVLRLSLIPFLPAASYHSRSLQSRPADIAAVSMMCLLLSVIGILACPHSNKQEDAGGSLRAVAAGDMPVLARSQDITGKQVA